MSDVLPNIAVIVLNNLVYDSRVLRISSDLTKLGNVTVFCLEDTTVDQNFDHYPFKVMRIPIASQRLGSGVFRNLLKFIEVIFRVAIVSREYKVIHANDLDGLIVAVLKKFTSGGVVIYDSHEWQSDQRKSSVVFQKFLLVLEALFVPWSSMQLTVSQSIAEKYSKFPFWADFSVVRNIPLFDESSNPGALKHLDDNNDVPHFVFAGMLGEGRDLRTLVNGFSMLSGRARLSIIGYGPLKESLEQLCCSFDNVEVCDAVPPDQLVDYCSQFDFGVVGGEHNICESFDYSLPNKLFTYIAAGLPVLVADLPEMSALVEGHGIGVSYKAGDVEGLVESVEELLVTDLRELQHSIINAGKEINWRVEREIIFEGYENKILLTRSRVF